MEKVRVGLVLSDDATREVPQDHAHLYEAAVAKLSAQVNAPGMSVLLSNLLFLPMVALANFFTALDCSFRVVYDPRNAAEDRAVKKSLEAVVEHVLNASVLKLRAKFLGLDITKESHNEFGLQIADLVAGEVRRFFRANPDLLTSGSDNRLIRFGHEEGETPLMTETNGEVYKFGRKTAIPPSVLKNALRPDEKCALPYLRKLLAGGLLTCVTEYGTQRDIALFDGRFWDICD